MKQKFFLFAFAFLMLSFFSCKKIEEYATITINGVNYSHDSEYFNGIQSPESSTVTVWKDCNVAEYVSKLKPLENGYPSYTLAFYLLLESDNEIKLINHIRLQNKIFLRISYKNIMLLSLRH